MEPKEYFPKIITDIQNVVSQLVEQFESSKEPITDDNTCLHKLCAKLEFVFSISLKEKNILGQKRSYWQWFYTSLRKKTGLNDSLKFVQANTEVRSSKGRGRAFIRYCLVHQTLADSLQNCLMIEELNGRSALKQDAVLGNKKYSSVLISSLYDLNAVYFDLNSKGYDLDAGWPTFASKRSSVLNSEHWAVQSQMALGSLPPPSVIMDSRIGGYHPSGSSGPPSAPSVDQRIEELVLELDQSDKTIKEQTKTIRGLESRNDSLEKSTMEKEEILAGVISDLETKNRHLHDAMSHMSSEYQTRDEYLTKKLTQVENKSKELEEKNVRLQDDKYNLEQLVSCRMTAVTQNFTSSSDDLTANEKSFYDVGPREVFVNRLQDEVDELRSRSERSDQYISCLEALVRTRPELNQHIVEMKRMMDEDEDLDCTMLPQSIDNDSFISNEARILHRIMSMLGMDEEDKTDDVQMEELVEAIDNLKEIEHKYHTLTDEEKQRSRRNTQNDKDDDDMAEIGSIKADRDFAMMEADDVRQQLSLAKTNVQDYKLQLEIQSNKSNQQIADLEEQLMLCRQQNDSLIFQRTEMMTDLTSTQEGLKIAQQKLEALTKEHEDVKSELAGVKESYEQSVFVDDQLEENRRTITGLESELRRNESCNSRLSHELEQASELVHRLKTDLQISNTLVESYTTNIQEVERRLSETENELEGAKTNAEEHYEAAQEARVEVQNLHNENEANRHIKKELVQLVVNFSHDFRELDNEEGELDEDDADISSLESSLNDGCELVSKISNKFIHLLRTHASLQNKLETNKDTLKKTKEELEVTETENTQVMKLLSAELHSLQKGDDNISSPDQLPAIATSLIDNYKEIVERRDSDIEQLKDKIGQLLQDKDKFWQDAHQLRSQLNHEEEETCSVCGKDNASKEDGETTAKCANCRANAGDDYVGGSLLGSLNHLVSSFAPSVSAATTASPAPPSDLAENEDYVEVEAKKIFQLPVFVEEEGLLVKWTITANLDINFSLFYTESEDEDDEETILIETQRVDCHLKPFSGQILAKCIGVYTLVLDNSYSKFTSKQVRYKLDIINPQDDVNS